MITISDEIEIYDEKGNKLGREADELRKKLRPGVHFKTKSCEEGQHQAVANGIETVCKPLLNLPGKGVYIPVLYEGDSVIFKRLPS